MKYIVRTTIMQKIVSIMYLGKDLNNKLIIRSFEFLYISLLIRIFCNEIYCK